MTPTQEAAEREAFEALACEEFKTVHRKGGDYKERDVSVAWWAWKAARATLSQQGGGAGEPVAFVVRDAEGGSLHDFSNQYDADQFYIQNRGRLVQPQFLFCYAAPPAPQEAREPLTEAEIVEAYCAAPGIHQFVQAFKAGARFAEAAHGIAATKGKAS